MAKLKAYYVLPRECLRWPRKVLTARNCASWVLALPPPVTTRS